MQGEDIFNGAIREVKEETGVCKFAFNISWFGSDENFGNAGSNIVLQLLHKCQNRQMNSVVCYSLDYRVLILENLRKFGSVESTG